jgi:hypothetical protein
MNEGYRVGRKRGEAFLLLCIRFDSIRRAQIFVAVGFAADSGDSYRRGRVLYFRKILTSVALAARRMCYYGDVYYGNGFRYGKCLFVQISARTNKTTALYSFARGS